MLHSVLDIMHEIVVPTQEQPTIPIKNYRA